MEFFCSKANDVSSERFIIFVRSKMKNFSIFKESEKHSELVLDLHCRTKLCSLVSSNITDGPT